MNRGQSWKKNRIAYKCSQTTRFWLMIPPNSIIHDLCFAHFKSEQHHLRFNFSINLKKVKNFKFSIYTSHVHSSFSIVIDVILSAQ